MTALDDQTAVKDARAALNYAPVQKNHVLVDQANERLATYGCTVSARNGAVVNHDDDRRVESLAAVIELTGEYDLATKDAIHDLLVGLLDGNDLVVADLTQNNVH